MNRFRRVRKCLGWVRNMLTRVWEGLEKCSGVGT